MDRNTLQALVDELQPWHYCHQFPYGIVTGTSPPGYNEKLELMTAANAWPKPEYKRVLDLGANSGAFSMWFADNKAAEVVAVEYSTGPEHFHKAYKQLCLTVAMLGYEGRVLPWCKNVLEGDFGEAEYDLIIFLGVLHHCGAPYHGVIFQSCYDALKGGGDIVVQTKPDQMVPQKLRTAGFHNIHQLPNYEQGGRLAWLASKT